MPDVFSIMLKCRLSWTRSAFARQRKDLISRYGIHFSFVIIQSKKGLLIHSHISSLDLFIIPRERTTLANPYLNPVSGPNNICWRVHKLDGQQHAHSNHYYALNDPTQGFGSKRIRWFRKNRQLFNFIFCVFGWSKVGIFTAQTNNLCGWLAQTRHI